MQHAMFAMMTGPAAVVAAAASQPSGSGARWDDCPGTMVVEGAVPASLESCVAASGPIARDTVRMRLGESVGELRARMPSAVTYHADFNEFSPSDDPMNIEWEVGAQRFAFENVGGTGQSVLNLIFDVERPGLNVIEFAWQNRPLRLDEAITRARRLQEWLVAAGFSQPTTTAHAGDQPFAVYVTELSAKAGLVADWTSAERLLRSEADEVTVMSLYTMVSPDAEVRVSLENMRRQAWQFGRRASAGTPRQNWRQSIFDGNGGYEWKLTVTIEQPR